MKKAVIILSGILLAAAVIAATLFLFPKMYEDECKTRVFEDMKDRETVLSQCVIRILPKTENANGDVTYGAGGSGVIFKKDGEHYTALTAGHVVNDTGAVYKVSTAKTEYKTIDDELPVSMDIEIPDDSFYDSLADAKVEYRSQTSDLAVISFTSKDELPIAELAKKNAKLDDKIMCIGYTNRSKYSVTYGSITSDPKTVTTSNKDRDKETTETLSEHDAYIIFGNSGGPAFNKKGKLVGINVAGELDLFGHFSCGYIVPCDLINKCLIEWKSQ